MRLTILILLVSLFCGLPSLADSICIDCGLPQESATVRTGAGSVSSPAIAPSTDPTDGFYWLTNSIIWAVNAGSYVQLSTNFNTRSALCYQWSSSTDPTATKDTMICRNRANVVGVSSALNLEPRATPPPNPVQGDVYTDSTAGELCYYDGSAWQGVSTGTDANCQ